MEQNLFLSAAIIFLVFVYLRKVLLYAYWWQVKEYRWDRMWIFLKTGEGRSYFLSDSLILKTLLVVLSPFNPSVLMIWIVFLLIETLYTAYEISFRKIRRPVFTLRIGEIFATSILILAAGIIIALSISSHPFLFLFTLAITDLASWLAVPLGILWTNPLVNITRRKKILEAQSRLKEISPVVVGITGSFGKTSTKEFSATVLSQTFKTAKNDKSENTEFGVANNVIKHVTRGTEIYLAEMGAYKIGEIAKLANFLKPKIGVLTSISNQHLALFGSLGNVKQAKYELIESLSSDGIAIFNGDDEICFDLAKKEKRKTIIYTTRSFKAESLGQRVALIKGEKIRADNSGLSFMLDIGKQKEKIEVPLLGAHFVQNLLGAAAIGHALGMKISDIAKGLKNIKAVSRTVEPKKGINESLIIDDSYSVSWGGFKAALSWLKDVKAKRKFVITPGIIELGEQTDDIHEELGRIMSTGIDKIFLTNKEFLNALTKGMDAEKDRLKLINEKELIRFSNTLQKGDIVLLEGRIPDYMRKIFIP